MENLEREKEKQEARKRGVVNVLDESRFSLRRRLSALVFIFDSVVYVSVRLARLTHEPRSSLGN